MPEPGGDEPGMGGGEPAESPSEEENEDTFHRNLLKRIYYYVYCISKCNALHRQQKVLKIVFGDMGVLEKLSLLRRSVDEAKQILAVIFAMGYPF